MNRAAGCMTLALSLALPGLAPAQEIEEVLAGAFGRPDIQFVEIEALCPWVQWGGLARLTFYDGSDVLTAEYFFPAAPSPCSGTLPVLIGTQAFADLPSAPDPDFLMPPLLTPGSGKVCFHPSGSWSTCTSYGSFEGDLPFQESPAPYNAPELSPLGICSLQGVGETSTNADYDLLPPSPVNARLQTGSVAVSPRFLDVPAASPFQPFAEALFNAGVTGGCGGGNFCPGSAVTREQMAVFFLLAAEGSGFQPPACAAPLFGDVPCSHPFARWINELARRGISGGCGGGNFCPGSAVTREQMAVFLLLGIEGPGFQPPACSAPVFGDVPCTSPFAPWINELAARGITGGCGGGAFCPGRAVTREQMAVFLATSFELPVPFRGCPPPPPDDHGDRLNVATPVEPSSGAPGTVVPGVLERPRDVEVFSFSARRGEVFYLDARNAGESEMDFSLKVLDCQTAQTLAEEAVGGFGAPLGVGFTAPRDGVFCLELRARDTKDIGPYEALLRGPLQNDHPGSRPGILVIDGPATPGEWVLPDETDTFAITTDGPRILVLEMEVDGPAIGWPELFIGGTRVSTGDRYQFYVREATTISVTFGRQGPGTYRLRVRSIPDDYGDTAQTATLLQSGIALQGYSAFNEPDVFRFEAAAGDLVSVNVGNRHDISATVFRLEGGSEVPVAVQRHNSALAFVVPAPGPYFVRLRNTGFGQDSFKILFVGPIGDDDHGDDLGSATPLPVEGQETVGHNEPFDGDVDVFSFAVEQDALYEVRLTEIATGFTTELTLVNATGNGVPTIQSEGWHKLFRAASGETLFARVSSPGGYGTYRVSVREFPNERGDTSSSVIALVPGAPPVNAGFDHPSDMDWYSFPATEGEYYVVKVWEPSSYPSNEQWSELELYDTDRVTRLSWATAGIAGTLLPFQPSHTGVYFIRARHTITQANPYEISVGSPIADDHGDVGQPTLLPLDGSPVAGNIEPWVDRDVFALDLAQGQTVTIEVTPLEEGHDTRISVWKPDLINQLGADDDGNGGFAPRVTFTAPASARYFAILSSWPLSSGRDRYTISARIE